MCPLTWSEVITKVLQCLEPEGQAAEGFAPYFTTVMIALGVSGELERRESRAPDTVTANCAGGVDFDYTINNERVTLEIVPNPFSDPYIRLNIKTDANRYLNGVALDVLGELLQKEVIENGSGT